MIGATFKRVNVENIRNIIVVFPPPDEQAAVAKAILGKAQMMDALIAEANTAINLLQERRSALISAAVTGKIDVRGLVPEMTEAA